MFDVIEDRGVWLAWLKVEWAVFRLQNYIVAEFAVQILKLAYSLLYTVLAAVGCTIHKASPHNNTAVWFHGVGKHVSTISMGALVVEGTRLPLRVSFYQESAKVWNLCINLLGLSFPPGFNLGVQRIGSFYRFPTIESLGRDAHWRGKVY